MNKLIQQILIWLGVGVIFVNLWGCDAIFSPKGDIVERVSDGDTIVISDSNKQKTTIRFACVDAPEVPHSKKERSSKKATDINQFSWGEKAQARVQELVNKGGDRIQLTIVDSDRYGRKVAEVYLNNGTFIQQVLLQEGLAKAYRPYLSKCPNKDLILQTETQAKQQQIGIWSDKKFVDPWDYRKLSKLKD